MKPKQRRYMPKQQAPILPQTHTMVFTVDTLTVVEASFTAMDAVFERQKHTRHPRLPFALETFSGVKRKVRGMLAQPGSSIAFDDNEITLLRACIQIYSVDLLCEPETPQRARLLSLCDQAAKLLPHPRPLLRVHD